MPIECEKCGFQTDQVLFRKPDKRPRAVRWMRWTLILAAILAVTSFFSLIRTMLPLLGVAGGLDQLVLQSTAAEEAEMRDFFRILSNFIGTVFTLALAGLVFLIVSYARMLRRRFRRADPRVLNQIRRLAWMNLVAQGASALLVLSIFSGLETQSVTPSFGFGIVVGPILLYLTGRKDVRTYFSHFVTRPAAERAPEFAVVPDAA